MKTEGMLHRVSRHVAGTAVAAAVLAVATVSGAQTTGPSTTTEILLKGDEGHRMLDNMTMDRLGRIVMQEDAGNNPRLGKIWIYNPDTALAPIEIAAHDPARFTVGSPGFLTQDEEASGVVDAATILGRGWFLLDVQAHHNIGDPELVEGGQLLAMYVDPSIAAGPRGHHHHHHEDDDEDDEDDD